MVDLTYNANLVPAVSTATNAVYVSKAGTDLNDGSSIEKAKLTFGSAIAQAASMSPTATMQINVVGLDSATYVENIVMASNVNIEAPEAVIAPTTGTAITGIAGTKCKVRGVEAPTGGIGVESSGAVFSATGRFFFKAEYVNANGTGVGFDFTGAFVFVECDQIYTVGSGSIGIRDNAGAFSFVIMRLGEMFGVGGSTLIKMDNAAGQVYVVCNLINGGGNSIGMDVNEGELNMMADKFDFFSVGGKAWDVSANGEFNLSLANQGAGAVVETGVVNKKIANQPWVDLRETTAPIPRAGISQLYSQLNDLYLQGGSDGVKHKVPLFAGDVKAIGGFSFANNVTPTVLAFDTYADIAGTGIADPLNSNWSFSTPPNELTYIGTETVMLTKGNVHGALLRASGAAGVTIRATAFLNGVEIFQATGVTTATNRVLPISLPITLENVVTNDVVKIQFKNESDGADILMTDTFLFLEESPS